MSETVAEILRLLTEHFGEDFQHYSLTLAAKRIAERVVQLRLPEVAAYYRYLNDNPSEPSFLARMLRIRFSSFFRDTLQFELLGSVIIPSMLPGNTNGFFRAWSAACAGGEEACTLAIIIDEAMQLLGLKTRVQIFATDIAEDALAEAEYGRYSTAAVAGVTLKRLNKYFIYDRTGYQISPRIKEMITYSRHDLLDPNTYAPPESLFGGFDLVSCRNFLMYLDPPGYLRVFDNLFRALNPDGVLLLGKAETVPDRYEPYLERMFDCGNLFRKRQMVRRSL
ncbi:CheR family methyltransferase [Citrifermentans bremense]|uniref:CheR family methyltransferase n=1 Tax=Citrifermentans bremense TaxID=60035 RepID=UPI0003FF093B|nr:protein-glutamate O-methyltransferase CheR [Citrifermentans bremense]